MPHARGRSGMIDAIRRRGRGSSGGILQENKPSTSTSSCTMVRQQKRRVCSIYKLIRQ